MTFSVFMYLTVTARREYQSLPKEGEMGVDAAVEMVANVVALNSGRLVGRTRFQKTMYLLSQLGVRIPFEFEYHHYGPYSAELADALDAAVGIKWLKEDTGIGYHDSAYSIFSSGRA